MGLTKQQIITVAVLLSGTFLAVLNVTLLSPALPTIMKDMHVDATTVQWLTSGYSLTEAVIIPLSAFIMGRLSTRKLYIGGLCVFAAGSLLAALAPQFGFLLLGRVLQAGCTGVVMPMVMSTILLIFPREKRGAGMGLVTLIVGFAPSLGPSLSGVLVDSVGWRALFGIVFALTLAIIVIAAIVLKNQEPFERTSFDPLSVVLSTFGLVAMLYGLSSFSSAENLAVPVALIVGGLALVGLFAWRQTRLESPMLRVDVLKSSRFRTAVLIMFCIQAALVGLDVLVPLYLQNVQGHTALTTGLVMLPGSLLGALTGFFAGRLFDRFGARPVALIGSALTVLGGAGLISCTMGTALGAITLVFAFVNMGLQLTITPVNTWGINSLDNGVIQHGNALVNTLNQVGGSMGTAILVSISALGAMVSTANSATRATFDGIHMAFFFTATLLFVMFLIVLFLVRDKRRIAVREEEEQRIARQAARSSIERANAKQGIFTIVHEAMNPEPYFVYDTATIREVTTWLAKSETSGIPVVSAQDGTVVGFISDGDLMGYLGRKTGRMADAAMNAFYLVDDADYQKRFKTLLEMNVMSLATRKVVSVSEDMPLDDATRMLAERRIKKLPVVDEGNRLVGTLSRRNVIQKLAGLLED